MSLNKLKVKKRSGMTVVSLSTELGSVEIVTNAYYGYAYMNKGYSELKKEAEELLGFRVHDSYEALEKAICTAVLAADLNVLVA